MRGPFSRTIRRPGDWRAYPETCCRSTCSTERFAAYSKAREEKRRSSRASAEAINVLTVGAVHSDSSPPAELGRRIDLYRSPGLPSPVNALGFGFRRMIKPEILLPGGRQLFDEIMETRPSLALSLNTAA